MIHPDGATDLPGRLAGKKRIRKITKRLAASEGGLWLMYGASQF
jgi:hypothetical protein